MYEQQKLKVR